MTPTNPAAHLVPMIGARLIWFCVLLVALDVFFIGVFAFHGLYIFLSGKNAPVLGRQWSIGIDGSYSEIFGYLKSLLIASLLVSIPQVWKRPIYLSFLLIATFIFLDDALQLHERTGWHIENTLVLMRENPGQLLFWAITGVPLLGFAVVAIVKSPEEDRRNGILLLGALMALAVFAVGVDFVHVILKRAFVGADNLFTAIEEGGEQIALSLTCCLAILIRRDLRHRALGSGTPA